MERQRVSARPRREQPDEQQPEEHAPAWAVVAPPTGGHVGHGTTPGDGDDPRRGAPDATEGEDRAAFAAVERREPGAIETFVRRFHPAVLAAARRVGIPPARRDEFAGDVLADVARRLALEDATSESPLRAASWSSPRAYLAGCVQKRYAEERRQWTARQQHEEALAREGRPHYEGAVAASCSEAALRDSEGPLWERTALEPAIRGLAAAVRAALTDEQARLLDMLTYGASYREIGSRPPPDDAPGDVSGGRPHDDLSARTLERAASAAKQRVYRLRKRLVQVALAYAADPVACPDAEYPHVRRLLRRSGLLGAGELGRLALVRCDAARHPYAAPRRRGGRGGGGGRPTSSRLPDDHDDHDRENDDARAG